MNCLEHSICISLTNSWNNQMRRAWGSRCVYFRWNTFNHQKLKEHKIIMANAWKVLSRRRKYLAQTWHCHSSFGQTSRLPKVILCLLLLSCSWHQTTNLTFPNYFHEFFSVCISFRSSNTQFYESWIFCLFTFRVFFSDKSFKSISKYTQKCHYNSLYWKEKKHHATP